MRIHKSTDPILAIRLWVYLSFQWSHKITERRNELWTGVDWAVRMGPKWPQVCFFDYGILHWKHKNFLTFKKRKSIALILIVFIRIELLKSWKSAVIRFIGSRADEMNNDLNLECQMKSLYYLACKRLVRKFLFMKLICEFAHSGVKTF